FFKILQTQKKQIVNNRLLLDLRLFQIHLTNLQNFKMKVVGCAEVEDVLKDLYELDPIERVKVCRNNFGQPVGSEARLLAGYLGIIARNANMLPINYESWHQMPDSNKNQALDNIKARFVLDVSDNYVKKALRKRWRDHKRTVVWSKSWTPSAF
ncbi:hypothetical protein Gotur_032579, partial [Gossypium turneri]